jgi:hypothetical protein
LLSAEFNRLELPFGMTMEDNNGQTIGLWLFKQHNHSLEATGDAPRFALIVV